MYKKLKSLSLIILIFSLVVIVLYWQQNWLITHLPFKSFTSIGQINDVGFVGDWGGGQLVLANLPSCKTVNDFYTDPGNPRKKYTLESKNIPLEDFLYKPVKVWGKVQVTSKILKPPEIVCIKAPCETRITEKTMFVEKVEINNRPLSSCQREYLEKRAREPRM